MTYRMFNDTALHKFRDFCVAANISQRLPSPQGAFDAMPRMVSAVAPDDREAELHKRVLDFLKDKLSEIDLFDVEQIMTGESLAGMDAGEPAFEGKTLVGGAQVALKGAMDAAGLRFRDRLHASARVSSDARRNLLSFMSKIGTV